MNDTFTFKIWDDAEKVYVRYPASSPASVVLSSADEAEELKDYLLGAGEYPDKPHSVFQVHKFLNGIRVSA